MIMIKIKIIIIKTSKTKYGCHVFLHKTSLGGSFLARSKEATNHKSGLSFHQLAAFLAKPWKVS
jgi:hypothetical protein